jgi:hypothetical protein
MGVDSAAGGNTNNASGAFANVTITYGDIRAALLKDGTNKFTHQITQKDANGTKYAHLSSGGSSQLLSFIYSTQHDLYGIKQPDEGELSVLEAAKHEQYVSVYFRTAPQSHGNNMKKINVNIKAMVPNSSATAGYRLTSFQAASVEFANTTEVQILVDKGPTLGAIKVQPRAGDNGYKWGVKYEAELLVEYELPSDLPVSYQSVTSSWMSQSVNSTVHSTTGFANTSLFTDLEIKTIKSEGKKLHVTYLSNGSSYAVNSGTSDSGTDKMYAVSWMTESNALPGEYKLQTSASEDTGFKDATNTSQTRTGINWDTFNENEIVLTFGDDAENFPSEQFDVIVFYMGGVSPRILNGGGPSQVVMATFVDGLLFAHNEAIADKTKYLDLETLNTTLKTASDALYGGASTIDEGYPMNPPANPTVGSTEGEYVLALSTLAAAEAAAANTAIALNTAAIQNQANIATAAELEQNKQDADAAYDTNVAAKAAAVAVAAGSVGASDYVPPGSHKAAQLALAAAETALFGSGTFAAPESGSPLHTLNAKTQTLQNAAEVWATAGEPTTGSAFSALVLADVAYETQFDQTNPKKNVHVAAKALFDAEAAALAALNAATAGLEQLRDDAILAYQAHRQAALVTNGTQTVYNAAQSAHDGAVAAVDSAKGSYEQKC